MSERLKIIPKKKLEIVKKQFEILGINDDTFLDAIDPIKQGSLIPEGREDLTSLVEVPLLEACQILYDKNIKTLMSSANKNDLINGKAYIAIDFDSLSPRNQEIARNSGEIYMMHGSIPKSAVNIEISVDQNTTVGQIRNMAKELVSKFEQQKIASTL